MADDLASFFKSKKSKKHGSGANVQNPDLIAKRLERTVQQQQVLDRENGIEENENESDVQPRAPYSQQLSGGGSGGVATGATAAGEQNNEESEWFDVQVQQEMDLAKLGVKEMELREESDEEGNEDEESLNNRKTWNIPGQQQQDKKLQKSQKKEYATGMDVDDGEEGASTDEKAANKNEESEKQVEQDDTETSKSGADKEEETEKPKYVPPSMRNKQLNDTMRPTAWVKKPNIEDSMEFPSLAAAGELEAEFEKTKKKKPHPQFSKKAASPAPAHAPSPSADESRQSSHVPTGPDTEVQDTKSAGGPPRSTYVPPHMRKLGGAS